MTGARSFQAARFLGREIAWLGGHDVGPVGPIFVFDQQSERRTERETVADAGQYLRVVFLDLHATPATISQLAAAQFIIDEALVHRQTGGQTFDDRDERSSV